MFRQLLVPIPSLAFVLLFMRFFYLRAALPCALPISCSPYSKDLLVSAPAAGFPAAPQSLSESGRVSPGALGEDDRLPYCVVSSSPCWFLTLMARCTNSNDNGITTLIQPTFTDCCCVQGGGDEE